MYTTKNIMQTPPLNYTLKTTTELLMYILQQLISQRYSVIKTPLKICSSQWCKTTRFYYNSPPLNNIKQKNATASLPTTMIPPPKIYNNKRHCTTALLQPETEFIRIIKIIKESKFFFLWFVKYKIKLKWLIIIWINNQR